MAIFKKENLARAGKDDHAQDERHTVMVVDDMGANVSVMTAILRPWFHVVEAGDGEEALRLVQQLPAGEQLACIVSDHRMPRMSGVQLFERTLALQPATRRVLVTAYMDVDAIVDAINRGAIYRFIAKPFDAGDFLLAVRCAVAAFEEERCRAAYQAALRAAIATLPEAIATPC
ncbi:response regulator [Massilia sp. Dwa41.01b]|uniref:response regulator n=1 Tax=Massilia sp. Dwa41.01b TaxID=2709302 RepID=UPI0016040BFE|nr:response regulator [Massilia sp. Dwa41.01b]QNA89016.1 response regulator [Massilia sp. Dwa41.01b]